MEDYLIPVNLKLSRAKKKIEYIHEKLEDWMRDNNFKFSYHLLDDKMGISIKTGNYSEDGFLDEISLTIGEIIHNLRSSLDNLAFAMARYKLDPPKAPHKIYFPIFNNEEDFKRKTKEILNQVDKQVAELITIAQPFNYTQHLAQFEKADHPLNVLQILNNFDKHRIPKVLLAIPKELKFNGTIDFENSLNSSNFKTTPVVINEYLKPNSPIFEIHSNIPIKGFSIDMNWTIEVAIEIPESYMNTAFLSNIHITIENLTNAFREIIFKSNS